VSERITEAELEQIADAVRGDSDRGDAGMPGRLADPQPFDDSLNDSIVRALVAEVRRLRALIVATCDPDQSLGEIITKAREMWAEACAIRDEQAVGTLPMVLGSPAGEPRVRLAGIPEDAAGVKRIWINGKPFVPEA
jgi:hypothetical protein